MKAYPLIIIQILLFQISMGGTLPAGFAELRLAQGLDGTSVNYSPDGRLFVTQKKGIVNIIKNGVMLSTPFMDLQSLVDNRNERGLQSLTFDPDFVHNGYVYIYYCPVGTNRNRVSRFTASGDIVVAGSEFVLVDLDVLPGSIHNGGGLFFKGGKLFITTGEGGNGTLSSSFSSLLGKALRINSDGTIPTDNPFYGTLSGNLRLIYALGFRNPFRAAVQPGTERVFINDVGGSLFEEINELLPGKNYGWPSIEGKRISQTPPANYQDPLYVYDHSQGCSIAGGTFYNPTTTNFPSRYIGKYFFGDYCNNYIKVLDPATGTVIETFATNVNRPISFTIGSDGSFYYLARGGLDGGSTEANSQSCCSEVWRVQFTNNGMPTISAPPSSQTVSVGGTAVFVVGASGSAPLAYQWQRNGADIPGATSSRYDRVGVTLADNSAVFRAVVSNSLGSITSPGAVLTVTSDLAPTATIDLPASGALYSAGTVLNFSGSGTDAEDGILPASAFTWEINFHHDTHTHPAMSPLSGVKSGTFSLSPNHDAATNVWYRIYLTVRDSQGQTSTTYRDVHPIVSTVTLGTNRPGLTLFLDGAQITSPFLFDGVAGIERTIAAPSPQLIDGISYEFMQWSDGGAATHTIATPQTDQTYISYYLPLYLEAEQAVFSGVTLRWGYTGFKGTGYGDYDLNTGGYIEWSAFVPMAGNYRVEFRYANGSSDRPLRIAVNGGDRVSSFNFPRTTSWTDWRTVSTVLQLNAGTNTIRATSTGSNGPNIDYLLVHADQAAPVVATPLFNPAPGVYTGPQQVSISTETSGATIRYTIDGSTPGISSPVYSGPVQVNSTTILKAIATKAGMTTSAVGTGTYTIDTGEPFTALLEAEEATLSGEKAGNFYTGFTGSGYVDYAGESGTYIQWTVNVPVTGNYDLDFRYANNSNNRPLDLAVNGSIVVDEFAFPRTNSWTNWLIVTTTVSLQSGVNTIRATTTGLSGPNVDHVVVRFAGDYSFDEMFEAEAATMSGVLLRANYPGYTGTGFGDYYHTSGDYLLWNINVPSAGNYTLYIRYALPTGNRPLSLKTNSGAGIEVPFPATGTWATWVSTAVPVSMVTGSNVISLTSIGYNGPNVDHIRISNVAGSLPAAEKSMPEYVRVAGEENEITDEDVMVFPIPASGRVTIRCRTEMQFSSLVLPDGRILYPRAEQVDENTMLLDVSAMPSGISIMVLRSGSQIIRKKIAIR
jgi:glucose/arabinose dehydrogenase